MNTPTQTPCMQAIADSDIERARSLLWEICSLAHLAINVARPQENIEEDTEDLHDRIGLMRVLLEKMGWVGDLALERLGAIHGPMRPEDWMLAGRH